jgi:hypothetical protein
LREQLVDRQRCLRCRQGRRRQHRCPRKRTSATPRLDNQKCRKSAPTAPHCTLY